MTIVDDYDDDDFDEDDCDDVDVDEGDYDIDDDDDEEDVDDDGNQVRGAQKTTCKGMRGAGYALDIVRAP